MMKVIIALWAAKHDAECGIRDPCKHTMQARNASTRAFFPQVRDSQAGNLRGSRGVWSAAAAAASQRAAAARGGQQSQRGLRGSSGGGLTGASSGGISEGDVSDGSEVDPSRPPPAWRSKNRRTEGGTAAVRTKPVR